MNSKNPKHFRMQRIRIAKFMGLFQEGPGDGWYYVDGSRKLVFAQSTDELKFDQDFNLLMMVVNHICLTQHPRFGDNFAVTPICKNSCGYCAIDLGRSNTMGIDGTLYRVRSESNYPNVNLINAMYECVIDFINWYNTVKG